MAEILVNIAISALVNAAVNALFPTQVEQPRLTNLRLQRSEYGAFIPRVWGPRNRIAGNVIYTSGLVEKKQKKKTKGKGKAQVTSYTYSANPAVLLANGETAGLRRIWGNGKLIFDRDAYAGPIDGPNADYGMRAQDGLKNGQVWGTIWFYRGTGAQAVNPYLEGVKGVGETPAYRHSTYVVIQDFQLADFGNGLPVLDFELEGDDQVSAGEIIRAICLEAGVPTISGIAGTPNVDGYAIGSTGPKVWDAIKPLLAAYGYDVADHGGDLRLMKRGQGMAGVFALDELGGGPWPANPADVVVLERVDDREMPRESTVTFSDYERDLQPNSAMARRQIGSAESKTALELPLVLTPTKAMQIAERALFEQWTIRRTVEFKGSRRHKNVLAGQVWGVPTPTRDFTPFRITTKTESPNGVIEFRGIYEDPANYTSVRPPAPATVPPNEVVTPGPTTLILMDAPMLALGDDDTGFYWVAAGEPPGWRGGVVYRSSDGGDTYIQMDDIGIAATIGDVSGTIPDGPCDLWDRATVITVDLLDNADELESVSELAVLNGANAAWIGSADGSGGEVIQFQTADLVAPGVYELSNLLRGRRGTDHATGAHGPGEKFVLIEPDTLHSADYGQADWNAARLYKGVSVLQDPDDVTADTFANTGERKRPFSPVHIRGERNGSNDLDISWIRRSRLSVPSLGGGPVPVGEANGLVFTVDLYDGATLVRTKSAVFASSFDGVLSLANSPAGVYTAAEQTADGITPGDPVGVVIRQVSDYVTDGHEREATV